MPGKKRFIEFGNKVGLGGKHRLRELYKGHGSCIRLMIGMPYPLPFSVDEVVYTLGSFLLAGPLVPGILTCFYLVYASPIIPLVG